MVFLQGARNLKLRPEPEEGPPAPPGRGEGVTHAQGPHVA